MEALWWILAAALLVLLGLAGLLALVRVEKRRKHEQAPLLGAYYGKLAEDHNRKDTRRG
jgi:hypothetical protein